MLFNGVFLSYIDKNQFNKEPKNRFFTFGPLNQPFNQS